MDIKSWKPQGKLFVLRIYFNDKSGNIGYLCSKDQKITIVSDDAVKAKLLNVFLRSHQIDYQAFSSVHALNRELLNKGLITTAPFEDQKECPLITKSLQQWHNDSLNIHLEQTIIKTPDSIHIEVDAREPEPLVEAIKRTGLNVNRIEIKGGGVCITHKDYPNDQILIKIKRPQDLYHSFKTNKHYEEVERYHQLSDKLMTHGVYLHVIWVFESVLDENMQPLNLFDSTKDIHQLNEWLSFIDVTCKQSFVSSLSPVHTADLIASFTQGYGINLYQPTIIDEERLDAMMKLHLSHAMPPAASKSNECIHKYESGLAGILAAFPLIDKNIARNLIDTGKNLQQITAMSKSELLCVNGIGEQKATIVFNLFNNTY